MSVKFVIALDLDYRCGKIFKTNAAYIARIAARTFHVVLKVYLEALHSHKNYRVFQLRLTYHKKCMFFLTTRALFFSPCSYKF